MIKQRNNTIAVIDLGSSKILCVIAKVSANKDVEIIGFSHNLSEGIRSGVIIDLQAATNCIVQSIEDAERVSGVRIKNVYVNIHSNNLLSHQLSSEIDVTGHEISSKDLNKMLLQLIDRYKEQQLSVVHSFTYDYALDGNRGITNPLGMYGSNLSCDTNIVLSPTNILANLSNCFAKCQLDVKGYISSAYVSGLACLSEDERMMGVILMELGAGCSSISIFSNGKMIYTDGIPLGGMNITNDIAKGLSISFERAERTKILYGNANSTTIDSKDVIEISDYDMGDYKDEASIIQSSVLSEIIKARAEEILELLKHKVINIGIPLSGNKIVLTGGAANLSGMKELVSSIFLSKVRIGHAKQLEGLSEESKDLGFTTAIGMINHAVSTSNIDINTVGSDGSFGKKIWKWLKENFI